MQGVGRKVKGVESSTSSIAALQANFGPGSSSSTAPDELLADGAEAIEAREMIQSNGDSMLRFLVNL